MVNFEEYTFTHAPVDYFVMYVLSVYDTIVLQNICFWIRYSYRDIMFGAQQEKGV